MMMNTDKMTELMEAGALHGAILDLDAAGALEAFLPEIHDMHGVAHDNSRGHHMEGDVFEHTMLVLKHAKPGVVSQLAALLHDVGKPGTQEILPDKITFFKHARFGVDIAESIVFRLGFDENVAVRVGRLVRSHMRPHELVRKDVEDKTVRRFVNKVGKDLVDELLDLAEADQLGNLPAKNLVPDLRVRVKAVMDVPEPVKPVLGGKDVMEILGIGPGPEIGRAMAFLRDKGELTEAEARRVLAEDFA
jgi:poly(A) polymerase